LKLQRFRILIDSLIIGAISTTVFYFLAADLIYSPSAREFAVSFAAADWLEINSNTAVFWWFFLCFFDALFLFLFPLGLYILSSVETSTYPVEVLRKCLIAGIAINLCYRLTIKIFRRLKKDRPTESISP
jgi:hypothetical protein